MGVAALTLAFCLSFQQTAKAEDSYPQLTYSLWGNISWDNDNVSGSGDMAYASLGLDWFMLPYDIAAFNTYVAYKWRSRIQNEAYYDANGPLAGMEFRGKYLSVGADYFKENLPLQPYSANGGDACDGKFPCVSGINSERMQYYATSFIQWDLSDKKGHVYLGLPGSIWANETYDDDNYKDPNSRGPSTMGFINQGIDWIKFSNGLLFNTFAEYRWRSKTVQNEYFDANGPAVGIDFAKDFYHIGADYYWQWFPSWPYSKSSLPSGPTMSARIQLYLTIYISKP